MGSRTAYTIDVDLLDPPLRVAEAAQLIPAATQGVIWIVGESSDWLASLDMETLAMGPRFDVADVVARPITGIGDGLAVQPVDSETFGPVAYWSPSNGMQRLDLALPTEASLLTGAGSQVVLASSDTLYVIDVQSGESVAQFPLELGPGTVVSEACMSPDNRYVGIVDSAGRISLFDVATGVSFNGIEPVPPVNGVGWASGNQLVYIRELSIDESIVQALDVETGTTRDVAHLSSTRQWWLATGKSC